jgi:hypothetical protein
VFALSALWSEKVVRRMLDGIVTQQTCDEERLAAASALFDMFVAVPTEPRRRKA